MSEIAADTMLHKAEEETEIPLLRGRVVSGMPLSMAARKRIVQHFEEMLGCHVRLSCRIDKKLIAGIRVELDGKAYDGTMYGQLKDVLKMLTRHDDEEEL